MSPSLSELAREGAESTPDRDNDNGSENSTDYERYDTSDAVWVKQQPTSALTGVATHLTFQPDFEQNDDGDWVPQDRGEFGVVLEDPDLYTDEEEFAGATIVAGESESGDDYRVYDDNDEETDVEADNERVIFGSNSIFNGEVVDAFDAEEILLKATGSSGRSIVSTLDVKGSGSAHEIGAWDGEDVEVHQGGWPQHSGHLFERHPDREDGPMPRVSVDPELRPDVEGNQVVVMLHRTSEILPDSDSNSYWATIFASLEDERIDELAERYADETEDADSEDFVTDLDGERMIRLQPTDEYERGRGNLIENGFIQWESNKVTDDEALSEARVEAGFDPLD